MSDEQNSAENQVAELQLALEDAKKVILTQEDELAGLLSMPLVYGTVLSSDHKVNPEAFEQGDKIIVIDEKCGNFAGRVGTIISEGVDTESGTVKCEFFGIRNKPRFNVGLEEVFDPETKERKEPQVHLLAKNDGSNIVMSLDGKTMEVWNKYRFDPKPGETAKCNLKTNQVIQIAPPIETGDAVSVSEVHSDSNELEVESGGSKKLVACYIDKIEVSDKVILDANNMIVVRHISNADSQKFKLRVEQTVTWDEIGGVDEAKDEIQEAILGQHKFPELFEFYQMETPAGFLLFGPPGCGKTLIGKATASELAKLHGKEAAQSGFNYVKGPEVLSMWVGDSEAQTRAIFARMRKHYEMHGYPALTFVDEADAIFTERGSGQAQKWHDTLVAMWLAEMDGFDKNAGILMFATNRPKALDGAVVREGRIDKHIKIPRPDREAGLNIFGIHLKKTPLVKGFNPDDAAEVAMQEFVDNPRPLYQVSCQTANKQETFCLSDCVSGSMIKATIDQAKSLAFRRDKGEKKPLGMTKDDIRDSVALIYMRHQSLNHKFDLMDFAEGHGMNEKTLKVDRVAAMG